MPLVNSTDASDEFLNNLRKPSIGLALCWKIERGDGVVQYFTNHDRPLTYDGNTYEPTAAFSQTAITNREGLSVDNLNLTALTTDDIPEDDLLGGVYDDARITIYLAQWDHPSAGLMTLRRGFLGEVKASEQTFETEVRGLMERLQRRQGKTYTLECSADLGDSRCKVSLAAHTYTGQVTRLVNSGAFYVSVILTDTAFQYGTIKFLTGANAGRQIEVRAYKVTDSDAYVSVLEPFPYGIAVGDQVEMVRGCDKTAQTCKNLFNNLVNFRGFPHMPTEEQAMEMPDAK